MRGFIKGDHLHNAVGVAIIVAAICWAAVMAAYGFRILTLLGGG